MLKKFLACSSVRERINFLMDTAAEEWTTGELDVVLNTVGVVLSTDASNEEKIAAVQKHLSDYKHEVEEHGEMDCEKVDSTVVREDGETLMDTELNPKEVSLIQAMGQLFVNK